MLTREMRSGRIQAKFLPVLVWLVALGCVGVLLYQKGHKLQVVGIAFGQQREIAATCAGRVRTVPVELFEEVKEGAILAVIDTVLDNERVQDDVGAQKAVIEAQIKRLRAELGAAEQQMRTDMSRQQNDYDDTMRRYAVNAEQYKLMVLEVKAVLEPDKVTLSELELELRIVKDLHAREAVDKYEVEKMQVRHDALARKIEENQAILAQAQKDYETAQDRLNLFSQSRPVPPSLGLTLNPILEAINVQEKLIDQLYVTRTPKVLASPFDGVVCKIYRRAGEAVAAGESVVTVAAKKPETVVAWARQPQLDRIKVNMPVELVTQTNPPRVVVSQVKSIGPQMELIPNRLWENPNIPEYGCPVSIAYFDQLKLVPNELVGVRGL